MWGEYWVKRVSEERRSELGYEEWQLTVADAIKSDPVWQFFAYRKALFLYESAWQDCDTLMRDVRGRAVAQQLIRSAGSISANIEEGHGRGQGRDRNYFLRIATGSARETKGWYFRGKRLLPVELVTLRMDLLNEIVALLVTELNRQTRHRR